MDQVTAFLFLAAWQLYSFSSSTKRKVIFPTLIPHLVQPHPHWYIRSHRIFFHSWLEELKGSYDSYRESFLPIDFLLMHDPLSLNYRRIRICGFASSLSITGLSNPRDPMALVNVDFFSPYRDFCLYHSFTNRDVVHFELPTPDTRCAEFSMRIQTVPQLLVAPIGISGFTKSRIQLPKDSGLYIPQTPMQCHLFSTHSRGPTLSCDLFRISCVAIPRCLWISSSKS
jgi:hypothetical protein